MSQTMSFVDAKFQQKSTENQWEPNHQQDTWKDVNLRYGKSYLRSKQHTMALRESHCFLENEEQN